MGEALAWLTCWAPGSASAGLGVLLCLPAGGAVSLYGAFWWCGWRPHMGGALKGAQIGPCGLSCAGVRAYARVCTHVCGWRSGPCRTRVR